MRTEKKGFTLVEILVATSILTMSIFGIYKIIGENIRLISHSSTLPKIMILQNNAKECLRFFGFQQNWLTGSSFSLNFGSGNTLCQTGAYNKDYSFSGVLLDTSTYYISLTPQNQNDTFKDWKIDVYEESIGKKSINWKQFR